MRILGMFARRPEPGKTKTRLAATIGNELAAELYAAFVKDLLQRVPPLADRFLLGVTHLLTQRRPSINNLFTVYLKSI